MGGATCRQIAKGGGTIIALDNNQDYVDAIATQRLWAILENDRAAMTLSTSLG